MQGLFIYTDIVLLRTNHITFLVFINKASHVWYPASFAFFISPAPCLIDAIDAVLLIPCHVTLWGVSCRVMLTLINAKLLEFLYQLKFLYLLLFLDLYVPASHQEVHRKVYVIVKEPLHSIQDRAEMGDICPWARAILLGHGCHARQLKVPSRKEDRPLQGLLVRSPVGIPGRAPATAKECCSSSQAEDPIQQHPGH